MVRIKVIITILTLLTPLILSAATIRVPDDYAKIQDALEAAQNGDVVLLADGTYTGTNNVDLHFAGKAITLKSENGPENCKQGREQIL